MAEPVPDMQIYALKTHPEWAHAVHASLREGIGRFGWSYMHDGGQTLGDADLNRLRDKISATGWHSLTADEQDRYQNFLLALKQGDWVVYVNVPDYGRCTLAKVTGPYYW